VSAFHKDIVIVRLHRTSRIYSWKWYSHESTVLCFE